MPQKRIYLYVPFNERNEARYLGAMWDDKEKKWFAPKNMDKNIFAKWLSPPQPKKIEFDEREVLLHFKAALEEQGLIIDGMPIMDGKIHRVKTNLDKGREMSGAYTGFLNDYPAGFIQNFKTNHKENWKMGIEYGNNVPIAIPNNQVSKKKEVAHRDEALRSLQEKTAIKLQEEYENANWAHSNHPYLKKKGFNENFYLKQDKMGSLLIPLKDENGKLWSVQRIFTNGDKIIGVIRTKEEKEQGIEYSARKSGCFHIIGAKNLESCKEFLIAEGFATAATIYKSTNKPVIMGVDSGNLIKIVEILNNKFKGKSITIIADNDKKREIQGLNNAGVEAAQEIKRKYPQTKIIIPEISNKEAELGFTDFNDIFLAKGLEEVKNQIKAADFHFKLENFKSKEQTSKKSIER